jgi:NAD(P)-dependent dehydrogenase (short-subunit alcohol dehydrogenase family)
MDRSVVVTGAGQGIGRACFDRLLDDGWFVVGVELDEELAARTEAVAAGRGAVVCGDVADSATHLRGAARARDEAPLAGWVNNAGIGTRGTLHRPDADAIRRVLDVNLGGTIWGCSAAATAFVEQRSGGAIVNI